MEVCYSRLNALRQLESEEEQKQAGVQSHGAGRGAHKYSVSCCPFLLPLASVVLEFCRSQRPSLWRLKLDLAQESVEGKKDLERGKTDADPGATSSQRNASAYQSHKCELQNGCCCPAISKFPQNIPVAYQLETYRKGVLENVVRPSQTDTLQSHHNMQVT